MNVQRNLAAFFGGGIAGVVLHALVMTTLVFGIGSAKDFGETLEETMPIALSYLWISRVLAAFSAGLIAACVASSHKIKIGVLLGCVFVLLVQYQQTGEKIEEYSSVTYLLSTYSSTFIGPVVAAVLVSKWKDMISNKDD